MVEPTIEPGIGEAKTASYYEGYESEAEQAQAYLGSLLEDESFIGETAAASTKNEQSALKQVQAQLEAALAQRLKGPKKTLEENTALAMAQEKDSSITDTRSAQQKLKGEWGKLIQAAKAKLTTEKVQITIEGQSYDYSTVDQEFGDKVKAEFAESFQAANEAISKKAESTKQELAQLAQDSEARRNDPAFLNALAVWGRAPNMKGDRGTDGRGFHAGIVHYVEYRRNADKAGRFTEQQPLTLDGFIANSEQLRAIVEKPSPEDSPAVYDFAIIEDDQGQQRLIAQTVKDTYISAIKLGSDKELRVITFIPGSERSQYLKNANKEVGPAEKDTRMNKLGNGRRVIKSWGIGIEP